MKYKSLPGIMKYTLKYIVVSRRFPMKIRRAAMVKKLTRGLTAKMSLKRYLFANSTPIYTVKKISRSPSLQKSPRRATFKTFTAAPCSEGAIKNSNLFHSETGTMLTELSNSVCRVTINGKAEGTGFLLFDGLVLTNGHVIDDFLDKSTGQLRVKAAAHFFINNSEEVVHVEEVVGFEFDRNEPERKYDWALLRLAAAVKLPCPLTQSGFPPSGKIYIIGHPGGGVKDIDSCAVIPTTNVNGRREQFGEIEGNAQGFTPYSTIQYETHFSYGSSGSPVFDEHGNVIAIHSGGYCDGKAEGKRFLAYGYLLSNVIARIFAQAEERNRPEPGKYLSYGYTHTQELANGMETLHGSRNPARLRDDTEPMEVD